MRAIFPLIVDLVLVNAKAYFRKEIVDCSIAVEDGEIAKIGKETNMPESDERIDLKNSLVLPGLIDNHVHLRDEGKAYKEDFFSGTSAAVAGGITTVLDMPNNDPVTMSAETLQARMQIASRKTVANVGFYSEFPNNLGEIEDIVKLGIVAFKLFMSNKVGGLNIDDDKDLKEAMEEAANAGVPVAFHAEDRAMVFNREQELKHSKRGDAHAFLLAHSEEAELRAIDRILGLTKHIDNQFHFCHVTIQNGLERITEAKESGRRISCEVTPHHLLLSSLDFERRGALLAVMPPLRDRDNSQALWKGISEGRIDVIGSDHAPHTIEEKTVSNIWDVKVGFPGLETTLPLFLTMIRRDRLSLDQLVELLAEKPAKIFGLRGRGRLEQGFKADMVAIDLSKKFKIDPSKFHSKAKFSPYEGWEVQGKPTRTFVNGMLVMDEGEIVAKAGKGEILRRGHA